MHGLEGMTARSFRIRHKHLPHDVLLWPSNYCNMDLRFTCKTFLKSGIPYFRAYRL